MGVAIKKGGFFNFGCFRFVCKKDFSLDLFVNFVCKKDFSLDFLKRI